MGTKRFHVNENVGKSKYVLSYHDGVKKHKDGSPAYDMVIFSSLLKLQGFVQALRTFGYTEGPP